MICDAALLPLLELELELEFKWEVPAALPGSTEGVPNFAALGLGLGLESGLDWYRFVR